TWLVPSEFAAPPGADNGSTLAKWHQNLGPDRKAMRTFVNRIPAQFFIGATTDESLDSLRVNEGSVAVMSTRRALCNRLDRRSGRCVSSSAICQRGPAAYAREEENGCWGIGSGPCALA
ncbi:MAG TPA: hypothetical protein VGD41_00300, partial [Pyrinomonadaceae bacterium]